MSIKQNKRQAKTTQELMERQIEKLAYIQENGTIAQIVTTLKFFDELLIIHNLFPNNKSLCLDKQQEKLLLMSEYIVQFSKILDADNLNKTVNELSFFLSAGLEKIDNEFEISEFLKTLTTKTGA